MFWVCTFRVFNDEHHLIIARSGRALHVPSSLDYTSDRLIPQIEHILHTNCWSGTCVQHDQCRRVHLRVRLRHISSSAIIILTARRDRDAKQKWAANAAAAGWSMGMGGIGGQILSGVVKNSVGRVFR